MVIFQIIELHTFAQVKISKPETIDKNTITVQYLYIANNKNIQVQPLKITIHKNL